MSDVDTWTCPVCDETASGVGKTCSFQRGIHARRHGTTRAELNPPGGTPAPVRRELVIPPAPKTRRRVR